MSLPNTSEDPKTSDENGSNFPHVRSGGVASDASPQVHRPRRFLSVLGDTALWFAASAGAICIILVVLAQIFSITLIMFKTGSMSPTIPAGSVALVREVPASEVSFGDIVTIDRPADLPVTHRVVSIEPMPNGQWSIVMKGDANEQNDPLPYEVLKVRQTLGHVPGLANFIVSLGSPWVMGSMTLGASALVTWAFWPRSRGRHAAK